jgi:hypothetical protein
MMAAPNALFETKTLDQLAEIVKADGRVRGAAEKALERFVSAHNQHSKSDSDSVWRGVGPILNIAGVSQLGRLKEDHLGLFIGGRAVFHAVRNYQCLPGTEIHHAVAEFNSEAPFPNQKEFILMVMLMPGKLALNFDEFDLLTIQVSDYLWPPMV